MDVARAIAVVCVALPALARADPPAAAPVAARVVHVPTAWLQPAGQLNVQLALSHRLTPSATAVVGLGEVAELDVELTDRLIACAGCPGADGERGETIVYSGTASFRMGVATGEARRWRVGTVLGFRRSFASRAVRGGGRDAELESAGLHWIGGVQVGGLQLHGGAELHDADHGGTRVRPDGAGVMRAVRPLGALAWTPPPYPRTTLIADVGWMPEVKDAGPRLHWVIGWGVRYQALRWGAIDLVVRQREDQTLGDATVLVRVTGAVKLGKPLGVGLR